MKSDEKRMVKLLVLEVAGGTAVVVVEDLELSLNSISRWLNSECGGLRGSAMAVRSR